MIRRNEIKSPFKTTDWNVVLSFINKWNFYQQYPARHVSSLYFDTVNLEFHRLGQEGIVPRDKVRLRWYGLDGFKINHARLEIKRTLYASREKYSKRYLDVDSNGAGKIARLSIYKNYIITKRIMPVICVTFDRLYFVNPEQSRATIDSNIKYHKCILTADNYLTLTQCRSEEFSVLEVKDESRKAKEMALKSRLLWSRFSKYSQAIWSFDSNEVMPER